MKEQHILTFKLPMIEKLALVESICSIGYKKTGNKFMVNFNGSKGYLSNIEISCEGSQKQRNNVIWVEKQRNEKGKLKGVMVAIFHSKDGIRVQIDDVQPKQETMTCAEAGDDLPF